MKEQYVGDISDYRKYALLRALAGRGENRIGVCWMLTPSDERPDGGKLGYLFQPERYRQFDPELFDILRHAATEPGRRRLKTIEDSGVIPAARYFNAPLPQLPAEREAYMADCRSGFAGTDLIFFDPDNGLDVPSTKRGRKEALKYVFLDEVAAVYKQGKSVVVYQHFGRKPRDAFLTGLADRLLAVAPDPRLWIFRTADVAFLLLIHPKSPQSLEAAAQKAATGWADRFITGARLNRG
jgi:hypothetical protein